LTPQVNEIQALDPEPPVDKPISGYPAKRGMGVVCYYCNKPNHMQRECHLRLRDLKGRNSRGGQNRYYYPQNGGVNNGFHSATFDREYPPEGDYFENSKWTRNYYSHPQYQQPLLPPHLQNYNHNYNNRHGPRDSFNLVDEHYDPDMDGDQPSSAYDEAQNE
jgi:hypothetical protein